MIRRMLIAASAVLLLVSPTRADESVEIELLRNGGFESGVEGWRPLNMSGSATFTPDRKVKKEGKQSLRIDRKEAGRTDFLKQSADLLMPTGKVKVSLHYKVAKKSRVSITAYFFDADGNTVGRGQVPIVESGRTKGFETASEVLEIPDRAKGVGLNVSTAQPGRIWIDGVSIVGQASSALPNPSFEDALEGWTRTRFGSNLFDVVTDAKLKSKGKAALRIDRDSHRLTGEDGVWAEVMIPAKRRAVRLTAFVAADGARPALVVQSFDDRGVCLGTERSDLVREPGKLSESWLDAKVPDGATRMRVYLLASGHGRAWFDNLSLTQVKPARVKATRRPVPGELSRSADGEGEKLAALPAKEARELRKSFGVILKRTDPASRREGAQSIAAQMAKYRRTDLVAALRKGPILATDALEPRKLAGSKEKHERFGSVLCGLTFQVGRESYRYAVDVPRGYDPKKPVGVLLDPGHGTGAKEDAKGKAGFLSFFRRHVDAAGFPQWLIVRTEIVEQVGAGGLRGAKPDDEVVAIFDACFRDLCGRFAVDPRNVYVTGLSQTGYWSWYLGKSRADRFRGIAPMSAISSFVNPYVDNFHSLPVYVLHGDQDPTCAVGQPRETVGLFARASIPRVHYQEVAGGRHDAGVWNGLPDGLRWLEGRLRARYPKQVAKAVQTLHDPWCHWLRIDGIAETGNGRVGTAPTAAIDAQIEGQVVSVQSDGVTSFTLCLASEMLDLDQPVHVLWNGKEVHAGVVQRNAATMLEIAAEKLDWDAVYEARLTIGK